ncbi:ADP-ribosylation factor-related protein 1 [Hordeum vulgare]|nr:ADP-ribosylation factor-related protein 1 [Hordeum vulgare]
MASSKPDTQTLASSNSPASHLATMGPWNYGRKGKHDCEAGSSSGHHRGSVKEEAASPPHRASAPAPFTIGPRPAGQRDRQYLSAVVCRRYWETRTQVSWNNVHLPHNWHLSVDRVPIPSVSTSGRAGRIEIERRRRLLPDDMYYDDRYAADSTLWDTWLRDEHDVRAREVRGRTRVRGLTPTSSPSPSPSPPPPPRMTAQAEARLMQRVMEDSMMTHDERQWPGLEDALALSAAGDVAIPELMEDAPVAAFPPDLVGQQWSWSCTTPEMAHVMGGVTWCPTPPRSPERDTSPWEEVLQAPASFQPAPAHHGPPAHLWTPLTYLDLVSDDDDTGGHWRRPRLRHRLAFFMLIMSNWTVLWP